MKRNHHRNTAAQKQKINYGKVEDIPFVVKPSSELSIVDVSPNMKKKLSSRKFL